MKNRVRRAKKEIRLTFDTDDLISYFDREYGRILSEDQAEKLLEHFEFWMGDVTAILDEFLDFIEEEYGNPLKAKLPTLR